MVCCLRATRQYLNHTDLSSNVLCGINLRAISPARSVHELIPKHPYGDETLNIIAASRKGRWGKFQTVARLITRGKRKMWSCKLARDAFSSFYDFKLCFCIYCFWYLIYFLTSMSYVFQLCLCFFFDLLLILFSYPSLFIQSLPFIWRFVFALHVPNGSTGNKLL